MKNIFVLALVLSSVAFAVDTKKAAENAKTKVTETTTEVTTETTTKIENAKQSAIESARTATGGDKSYFFDAGDYGKTKGLLGPVIVGPLVGMGFPRVGDFGIEAKAFNLLGLQLSYGYFPTLSFGTAKLGFNNYSATLKVYPFKGSFYIGSAFGKQSLSATGTTAVGTTTDTLTAEASSVFATPQIGWRWTWESGFFMGMELGYQLSLSSTGTITSSNAAIDAQAKTTQDYKDLQNNLNKIGEASLPHFALLQLGFFF